MAGVSKGEGGPRLSRQPASFVSWRLWDISPASGQIDESEFMTQPDDDREKSWRDSLPFPAHWLWYIAAKLMVLALAALIALRWKGLI
jgi:hypothetical protein